MSTIHKPVNDDIFLFDREELQKKASEKVVRQGLTCFNENRVLELDRDEKRLWAVVEDDQMSDFPLAVQVELSPENQLIFSCDCPESQKSICLHHVAALFAYADFCQENEGLMSAVDNAIQMRIKRARTEVRVKAESGEPWFGSWRASSINSAFSQNYRVTIRNLDKRNNYCSCPDFAGNQLGTCKHIEAVLHKIRKQPEYEIFKKQPIPFPYIYLAWDHDEAPMICVHRSLEMTTDLQQFLSGFFAPDGRFTARMPDDFFRFVELADQRGDIHIGEDAVDWANHQTRAANHRLRSEKIRERIESSRGGLPGIKAKLYPYQITGTAFLAGTGRALLADDMGLGKTLQAISAATWLKNNEGVKKVLIVCPASLKQQWAREVAKFTDLQTQIIDGPPPKRASQYRRQVTFFVLNYELILRDLSIINETLRPDLIIMDEAQRIKNWRTKIAAAVKLIPSRFTFVLTGTPLENRLEDLYSLMQVVDPKVLGPLWRYMVDFHVTDERNKVLGYRNLSILRQRLKPVMLRRDRSLVNDQLPERITQRLDVTMTAKQVEIHDDGMARAGQLAQIAKKRPLTPSEQNRLIAALQQARMACNSAGLVDKETEESPKIDELEVLLDEICLQEGRKAVVFSQWEMMTRMVEKRLNRMGLGYVRLHGGVPTARRGELMDRFREDDAVQVFVSTDAGGVGLNLQSGSVLVNLDVPWNPAVLEQRNARIHRLGQTRKVQIVTMVAANSYEEQVLVLVGNKQNLFDNVIKEDATEDVVGVSKKLLETLVEDLAGKKEIVPDAQAPKPEDSKAASEEPVAETLKPGMTADARVEEKIRFCIEALQKELGPRIERILGSRGGLICVIDRVDSKGESLAVELSQKVPVALIDHFALQGLNRLRTSSPLADAQTVYMPGDRHPEKNLSRLAFQAVEKLAAARVLCEQNMGNSAVELLVSALLAKAADLAGLEVTKTPIEAGVWIYSEALPKGMLTDDDAVLIMRAVGLSQSDSIPQDLIDALVNDVTSFVTGD
ncbi:MAG: DEAD/DEAH box helicase [Pseudomonadota bacterium]